MGDDASSAPARRRVLAGAATLGSAAVAGCSGFLGQVWDQTGATDVALYNVAETEKTVTVTVTASGADEPHTDRTLTLAPGESVDAVNDSKLPTNAAYTVAVSVAGGPSETFAWEDPRVELAPLYVLVDGSENVDFLLKAG